MREFLIADLMAEARELSPSNGTVCRSLQEGRVVRNEAVDQ